MIPKSKHSFKLKVDHGQEIRNVMERMLLLFFLDLDFRIANGDVKTYAIIFIRLHLQDVPWRELHFEKPWSWVKQYLQFCQTRHGRQPIWDRPTQIVVLQVPVLHHKTLISQTSMFL